jgi:hypothetical protein
MIKNLLVVCTVLFAWSVQAQSTSDFENLQLPTDTFWNGQAQPMGASFSSGHADFHNLFDTAWGGFWSQGWAYSTMRDTTTAGFTNLYATAAYNGHNGSNTYVVGQQRSVIRLTGPAAGSVVRGAFFSNSTYAWLSMRDGDAFAKQFGGQTGDDPDYFALSIKSWYQGQLSTDSVLFYLADYRFTDNTQNYIVTDWRWVDLSALGNCDSLIFELFSSDVGSFGMNTPAFFCMDDLITENSSLQWVGISKDAIKVFPNPVQDYIVISGLQSHVVNCQMKDLSGRVLLDQQVQTARGGIRLEFGHLPKGIYLLSILQEGQLWTHKIQIR